MEPLIISVSGMRGVVGEGLTPEVTLRFASAFGHNVNGGKVILGRDPRPSGGLVRHAVLSGLLSTGCEVVDLGVCPTPSVHLNVRELKASGGLVITASHNPIEWNGLKAVNSEGIFLSPKEVEIFERLMKESSFRRAPWHELRSVEEDGNGIRRHVDKIKALKWLDVDSLKRRKFKVAVDCCNGATSLALPELLKELGCEVVELFCEPGREFPRGPEPVRGNLTELGTLVKQTQADIGFGIDPDGDRASVVSEEGSPLGEEYTLALATQFVLRKESGKVVTNLSTSRMIEDVARQSGAELVRAKVGEAWVVDKMRDIDALIGGEGNGGVILPRANYTRDSLVGVALILQHLLESGGSVSELRDSLPKYHMVKTRVACDPGRADEILSSLRDSFAEESLDLTDGIRVDWPDSWIHVRKSNTEPVLRVIGEGRSKEKVDRLVATAVELAGGR